jgi:hypothetical protein
MQRSPDSPIPADRRVVSAADLFPDRTGIRVPASLTIARTSDVIEIPTS